MRIDKALVGRKGSGNEPCPGATRASRVPCPRAGCSGLRWCRKPGYPAAWADHIVALRGGRVVGLGTPETIVSTDGLRAAFGTEIEVTTVAGRIIALHHV